MWQNLHTVQKHVIKAGLMTIVSLRLCPGHFHSLNWHELQNSLVRRTCRWCPQWCPGQEPVLTTMQCVQIKSVKRAGAERFNASFYWTNLQNSVSAEQVTLLQEICSKNNLPMQLNVYCCSVSLVVKSCKSGTSKSEQLPNGALSLLCIGVI